MTTSSLGFTRKIAIVLGGTVATVAVVTLISVIAASNAGNRNGLSGFAGQRIPAPAGQPTPSSETLNDDAALSVAATVIAPASVTPTEIDSAPPTSGAAAPATLLGTARTIGGVPVGGVALSVRAAAGGDGEPLHQTTTSANGKWGIPAPVGCYQLTLVAPPGYLFVTGDPTLESAVCVNATISRTMIDVELTPPN